MKKRYITPSIEQIEIEPICMLAASEKVNVYIDEDKAVDADASLSNNHRGNWGNLWNNESK